MAYISKEEVKAKSVQLAKLNKEYGVKARFSGSNSSALTLTIHEGVIDFISNYIDCLAVSSRMNQQNNEVIKETLIKSNYIQVNHYYMDMSFCGVALEYLQKAYAIMLDGHKDDSDVMTDYFNCSWYNYINIGKWNKGYKVI